MSGSAHYSQPFQGKDDLWYWNLRAANGEIVSQSEGYQDRDGAVEGIKAAHRAALEATSGPSVYTEETA